MNLMIDLETLGTIPGSAILTIGACFFDQVIGHQFYKPVSLKSQIRYGFTIDPETINWWSRQNKTAQNASFGRHKNEATIKGSLGALSHFIHYSTDQGKIKFYVWSHGASPSCLNSSTKAADTLCNRLGIIAGPAISVNQATAERITASGISRSRTSPSNFITPTR